MKKKLFIGLILLTLAFLCPLTCFTLAFASGQSLISKIPSGQVLILNSYHSGFHWSDREQATLVSMLERNKLDNQPVVEYMDCRRHPDAAHLKQLQALYQQKYHDKKFSLVVTLDDPAFNFAIKYHTQLFGEAPVVFCGVGNFSPALLAGDKKVTGFVDKADPAGAIEVMLRLHPHTREIFILHDYTNAGLAIFKDFEALLPRFAGRIRFRSNDNLVLDEIVRELKRLPQDALVLLLSYAADKTGQTFDVPDVTRFFSEHSPVAIYGHAEVRLGHGIVGGKLLSPVAVADETALLIRRILQGEDVQNIPVVTKNTSQYMFDYEQMQRFHIPLSSLPPNSIIINRPVSFFAAHRKVILAAAGIIIFMSILILLLLVNIFQRRRSASTLQASEEKYRSLASTVDELVLVDRNCRFLFANETYLDRFGSTKDSIIGKKFAEFHSEEAAKIFALAVESVIATGYSYQDEWRGQKSGKYWLRTFSPVKRNDGSITAITVTSKEITDRRQAEEALQKNEQAAQQLARENELIAEIGRIISSTLNIEEVYARFAEKVKAAIPFDHIIVNTINKKDYTRTVRYVDGDLAPGNYLGQVFSIAGTRTEHVVRTKSSLVTNSKNREDRLSKFPRMLLQFGNQSLMVPLISKDEVIGLLTIHSAQADPYSEKDLLLAERVGSQIAGAIANAQLFLERNQAEEEKRILSERLQRAEKMEALGTLAGGVAHDLNNVLGVLSGYSELLVERLAEGNPLREYAANILKSSEKGAAIIQDLLTLARRGVSVSEIIDLNRIIANLLATPEFNRLKDYHPQVNFRTGLTPDLLNIKGSPVHLEKTVLNLLSNAAEAVIDSGEVQIRTENRYLDKAILGYDKVEKGEYVVLTVADTGKGISAEDMNKMFEPFYTKKKMGRSGTGLGLAIVWGTVKDHNGYINVQSSKGEGTTFTLYFPVTREKPGEDQQKIPREQYLGHGESVLVVDDVPEQRQVASTLLMRLGYQAAAVASGEEALEYLRNNQADVIVLDMIMDPGIDGLETYKRILEINPHQKAIIVSGFSETDRAKEAQQLGTGAYVKKPYTLEKIGVAIRVELNRK